MIRQARDVCWRELPAEGRSLAAAEAAAREALERNFAVWKKIKKPTPESFFQDMEPREADRFLRQAMLLCWMMMPRTGGREVPEVLRIVGEIFERNMRAWEEDEQTFTGTPKKTKEARPKPAKKSAAKAQSGNTGKATKATKVGAKKAVAKR